MKKYFLPTVLVLALALNACNKSADVSPTSPSANSASAVQMLANLDLTSDQAGQLDEMFYLGEDLETVLTPQQAATVNNLVVMFTPPDSMGGRVRAAIMDFDAMMYFRLIIKANPTMTDEQKKAIYDLIVTSSKNRLAIILANKDNPTAIPALLKAEHDALIAAINELIGPEAVQATADLKAKLEQQRIDRMQKMIEMRINNQVMMLQRMLKLDQTQADAIKAILLAQETQIQALREQYKGNPEGFRAALQELQKATDAQIAALLTPEQLKIWQSMMNRRHGGMGGGGPIIIRPRG